VSRSSIAFNVRVPIATRYLYGHAGKTDRVCASLEEAMRQDPSGPNTWIEIEDEHGCRHTVAVGRLTLVNGARRPAWVLQPHRLPPADPPIARAPFLLNEAAKALESLAARQGIEIEEEGDE
jgi:hypothetical protein